MNQKYVFSRFTYVRSTTQKVFDLIRPVTKPSTVFLGKDVPDLQ